MRQKKPEDMDDLGISDGDREWLEWWRDEFPKNDKSERENVNDERKAQ